MPPQLQLANAEHKSILGTASPTNFQAVTTKCSHKKHVEKNVLNDQYTLFISHILQVTAKCFLFFFLIKSLKTVGSQRHTRTQIHAYTLIYTHTCIQRFVLVDPEAQRVATQPDGKLAQ